jgi:hypothetical protein
MIGLKRRIHLALKLLGCLIAAAVMLVLADYFIYPNVAGTNAGCANKGENGLWLRYLWYFGKKSSADEIQMAETFRKAQIKYAYFHVFDVTPDGQLRYKKLKEGRHLVEAFHKLAPGTKIIAWVSAGDYYPAHGTNLSDPKTIPNMCETARWLVNDCGFDGLQWDYEPTSDPFKFVELLRETRAAITKTKWLSTAGFMIYPGNLPIGWTGELYAQSAKYCDDVAVMGYDSGCLLPQLYEALMAEQVVRLTNIIGKSNPACKLIIGVPTYDRHFLHDHTETLRVALVGVRNGLSKPETRKEIFAGVAPFADYTTEETEWETYHKFWLCR